MYDADLDEKKKLKIDEVYKVKISRPRNIRFHRKFFALIKLVYDNQERFNNLEYLRKELTIAAGFYDTYIDLTGVEVQVAKSISFGSMDEDEFSELYSRFIDAIGVHFGFEKQSMMDEVEQYY